MSSSSSSGLDCCNKEFIAYVLHRGKTTASLISDDLFQFIRYHYLDYVKFLIKQSSTIMEYSNRMDLLLGDVQYVLEMENGGQNLSFTNAYGYDSHILVEPYADTNSGSTYQSDTSFSSTEGSTNTNDSNHRSNSPRKSDSSASASDNQVNDSSFSSESHISVDTDSFDFEAMGIHYDDMKDDQYNSKVSHQLILPLSEIPRLRRFQELPLLSC